MIAHSKSLIASALVAAAALAGNASANKPTFKVNNLPDTWEKGQTGSNQCKKWQPSSQDAECQNIFINSVSDFCLWAPPQPADVGSSEEIVVSYCTKKGYGTRLIPAGTLTGAHFIKTPDFVQVTGHGDFTKINVKAKDQGGELDPHGATGYGNPRGGLVFSNNIHGREGEYHQIKEWSSFIGADTFSFRACYGKDRTEFCPHVYDVMGSMWNHPGNYSKGSFDNCEGTSGHFPGVYHGSTFSQGQSHTPKAHKAGHSSDCTQATLDSSQPSSLPYRRRSPRA